MSRKKLKNVYELLESGNNKKVILEVDKLISSIEPGLTSGGGKNKRQPLPPPSASSDSGEIVDDRTILLIGKALKCLALVRTDKKDEADKLIDELLNLNTTDENALSIIMQYCKETQQLSKIVSFYENAAKNSSPSASNHEEILTSLFYAYVRNRDFAKQQQVAIRLYKETNKIMYSYWNAMSYYLMNLYPASTANVDMYLQLAEKLLEKCFVEKKMTDMNGEYLLYLEILIRKKKFQHALNVLNEADENRLGQVDFKLNKQLFLYKSLADWQKIRELCEQRFSTNDYANESNTLLLDNWTFYLQYIESLIEILKSDEQKSHLDKLVDETISRFDAIKSKLSEINQKAQAPYLAKIDLIGKLYVSERREDYLNKLRTYLTDYLNAFSSKPGFFYDMVYFAELIEKHNLVDYVLDELKRLHDSNRPFKSIKSIYQCLSYWQLSRYFGKHAVLSVVELTKLVDELEKMYLEALEYGKDLPSTAYQYADEFILLSTYVRLDIIMHESQVQGVFQLIVNVKTALTRSPSNHQLKLLLINLFSLVGAYDAIQITYESLEIKNIQNYSISYLITTQLVRLGSYTMQAQSVLNSIYQFFTSNIFDLANYLVNCFKYGSFLKLIEMVDFINTVRDSLAFNASVSSYMTVNAITMNAAESTSDDPIRNYIQQVNSKLTKSVKEQTVNSLKLLDVDSVCKSLSTLDILDHNDHTVLYNWECATRRNNIKLGYDSLVDEQKYLVKLRFSILNYMNIFLNGYFQVGQQQKISDLRSIIVELGNTIESKFKSTAFKLNNIYTPRSDYLSRTVDLGLIKMLTQFVALSNDLTDKNFLDKQLETNNATLDTYKQTMTDIGKQIRLGLTTLVDKFTNETSINALIISELLEGLSSCLEVSSYCIILLSASLTNPSTQMNQLWSERLKKSKKKKETYLKYVKAVDLLHELYEELCHLIGFILAAFFKEKLNQSNLNVKWETLTAKLKNSSFHESNDAAPGSQNNLNDVFNSYVKSLEELKKLYVSKLKLLLKLGSITIDYNEFTESLKF